MRVGWASADGSCALAGSLTKKPHGASAVRTTLIALGILSAMTRVPLDAQRPMPSAQELLNQPGPLQSAEVAVVLEAARAMVAGKTCRLAYVPGGPGPQVLIGPNGRPRFLQMTSGYDTSGGVVGAARGRDGAATATQSTAVTHMDLVTFLDYTGTPARRCDGTPLAGDLVIEYEQRSTDRRWTARARTRSSMEVLAPAFEVLAGLVPADSGEPRQIGDRRARAFTAPWYRTPEERQPTLAPAGRQSLWIDTMTLLPVRWSVAINATPAPPEYNVLFTYDPSITLQPPANLVRPDCVR
jgi:hypothetical protein